MIFRNPEGTGPHRLSTRAIRALERLFLRLTPASWRRRESYRIRNALAHSQWLQCQPLRLLLQEKLRTLLLESAALPYYTDLFKQHLASSHPFTTPESLTTLPLLNPLPSAHSDLHLSLRRRGTDRLLREWIAAEWHTRALERQWLWTGHQSGDRHITLSLVGAQEPPPWQSVRSGDQLRVTLSPDLMNPTQSVVLLTQMAAFDPILIQGSPEALNLLAMVLESRDEYFAGESLRSLIIVTEPGSALHGKRLRERFNTTLYPWFSTPSDALCIGTCEYGRLHIIDDLAWVETMAVSDRDPDRVELISTPFHPPEQIVIRQRTGVQVTLADHQGTPCPCGRCFTRIQEVHTEKSTLRSLGNSD
ncbi:MAG: hypothetical protein HQL50_12835 [Magnetococcales bacterium]|nr:hypothetical protein [Magnetococcales bacterium]